jgi:hypothetical protein
MVSRLFRELNGNGVATGKKAPDKQESAVAKREGGRVHRRSGAGIVKWDGSSKTKVWDAKHTDGDTIRLPRAMLSSINATAWAKGKWPFFDLEFSRADKTFGTHWFLLPLPVYHDIGGVSIDGVYFHRVPAKGSSIGISLPLLRRAAELAKGDGKLLWLVCYEDSWGDNWVLIGRELRERLTWQ